jgi:uncharacterized lipoprotein YmbA
LILKRIIRLWLTGISFLLVAGCASAPSVGFFALDNVESMVFAERFDYALAIGPIDVPVYLDRPQIVTRAGGNRLIVDEFNRWGGPLEDEISRVVTQHLVRGLRTERVYGYPSRLGAEIDYRLALSVQRFDGEVGSEAILDVAWSLINERTAAVIETRHSTYREPWPDSGYESFAEALSRLLGRFGDQLIRVLEKLPGS